MKNLRFEAIIRAIDGRHLLRVADAAGPRVIEPYLIFESASGDMLLHGWQRSGAFRSTPPPRWCNLHLNDIVDVQVLADRFSKPRHDYNPYSSQFHQVLYAMEQEGHPDRSELPSEPGDGRIIPRRGPPDVRNTPNNTRGRKRRRR